MKAKKFPFNRDELIGLIDYNPLTGAFKSKCLRGNLKIGDRVGYKNVDGYIRLKIGNELFSAQRVAWFIYHGYDPYGYKKSDRKLYTLAQDYPEIFEFPKMLEEKYSRFSNNGSIVERKLFRRNRSTIDLLNEATIAEFNPFIDENYEGVYEDECAEECGSFMKD